ncbi:MAG: heme A synthase [Phycisphaerae bacterium]
MNTSPTPVAFLRGEEPSIATPHVWLHRYAVAVACATLCLIIAGAMVTSTGSGLSVPDWPTTYGQNMFTYPPSRWVGGIFYEHGHRLIASTVGLMAVVLAVWLWRCEPRRWMRVLGGAAVLAVIAQGVLGGLTVLYLLPTPISVLHGCLAQTFFCITIAIAVFTSPGWLRNPSRVVTPGRFGVRGWCCLAVGVVFLQLILGAVMRHTGSGRAVLDFPLAYGQWFPDLSATAVENYNIDRVWEFQLPAVMAEQIAYHMTHRIGAVVVTIVLVWTVVTVLRRHAGMVELKRPAVAALFLLVTQLGLGAWTVWSGKDAWVTSAHVAVGAATLGCVWILALRACRRLAAAPRGAASSAVSAQAVGL